MVRAANSARGVAAAHGNGAAAAPPRRNVFAPGDVHAPRLANARRRAAHAAVLVAGWALFGWSWHLVTANSPELGDLRLLIVGAALVVPVLTLSWIVHNVGIYRRKGPRRAVPTASTTYTHDYARRRIEADWTALRAARCIEITAEGDVKRYRAVVAAAPPGQAAGAPPPEPALAGGPP